MRDMWFYLQAAAGALRRKSGGEANVTWHVIFKVEKWRPATQLAAVAYPNDSTPVFREAKDFLIPPDADTGFQLARVHSARARWVQVPKGGGDHIAIAGFWCGDFSGLNGKRPPSGQVIRDGSGKSGSTFWSFRSWVDFDPPEVALLENDLNFDAEVDKVHGDSGLDAVKQSMEGGGYQCDSSVMQAPVWGREPQKRCRVYVSCHRRRVRMPLSEALTELKPVELFCNPIEAYLQDQRQAAADVWLTTTKMTEFRQPDSLERAGSENLKAKERFITDQDLAWPPPIVHASGNVSSRPEDWGLDPRTFVQVAGLCCRAALILFARMVKSKAVAAAQTMVVWLNSEMGWDWSARNSPSVGPAPTLTSAANIIILTQGGPLGYQFRWFSPLEGFRLQGLPLENILSAAQMAILAREFKYPQLVRMFGQSFHFPCANAFVWAAVVLM